MKTIIFALIIFSLLIVQIVYAKPRAKIITGTHIVWIDSVDFIDFDGHIAIIQSSGRIRIISGTEIPIEK